MAMAKTSSSSVAWKTPARPPHAGHELERNGVEMTSRREDRLKRLSGQKFWPKSS